MYPQPGQFGVVRTPGIVGRLISAGQRIAGSGSYYTHAFLVIGGGYAVQSQAHGAELTTIDHVTSDREAAYSALPLSDVERAAVCAEAMRLVGTPYSYLDYFAIAAARVAHTSALYRFVGATGHMICSQLVDEAYRRAGIELFHDRIPGDVTPGDLARLIGV